MTRRPRPKRKSRKQTLKDFEALLVELTALRASLKDQIERTEAGARCGGLSGVWNELNRRHQSINKSVKQVRAAIRKMKRYPTTSSMVPKPGDNTVKVVPGGEQGLGTLMQETRMKLDSSPFEM